MPDADAVKGTGGERDGHRALSVQRIAMLPEGEVPAVVSARPRRRGQVGGVDGEKTEEERPRDVLRRAGILELGQAVAVEMDVEDRAQDLFPERVVGERRRAGRAANPAPPPDVAENPPPR